MAHVNSKILKYIPVPNKPSFTFHMINSIQMNINNRSSSVIYFNDLLFTKEKPDLQFSIIKIFAKMKTYK